MAALLLSVGGAATAQPRPVPVSPSAADAACGAQQRSLLLAVAELSARHAAAPAGAERAAAAAALGATYLQLNRLAEAETSLQRATAGVLTGRPAASAWIDLGNVYLARGQSAQADASWLAALRALPGDTELAATVELNRARLASPDERPARLREIAARLAALPASATQAKLFINLAAQALDAEEPDLALAFRAYDDGRRIAQASRADRLAAEAMAGLADLYERQQRHEEALALAEVGLVHARRAQATDWLMQLEARAGRAAQALGREELALAAFRRAALHVEAVRSDIPVQYADGRSSFRATLEPIYLGLTDQLLRRAARLQGGEQASLLRQARDTVELIKQTELEDYFRDRCSLDAPQRNAPFVPAEGTAIYYPVILPDRLELLVETTTGIQRRSIKLDGAVFRDQVLDYVAALRAGAVVRSRSRELYRQLIAPIDSLLNEQRIHTLVVVPDGPLRLLPMASLNDGQRYLLQRLAVATVPGLKLTAAPRAERRRLEVLLAGMSQPGPVTEKLTTRVVEQVLDPGGELRQARSLEGGSASAAAVLPPAGEARSAALRQALALPGVKQEIENISRVMQGTVLMDSAFTLQALQQQLREQRHPVVHIASHGLFGDSADSTFIMTYDEVLTLDGLQTLLRGRTPVELLILSACQTAEGDDRAPLGMAGTALKAGARTAMGTLWPVFDEAASRVMSGFYQRLAAGGTSRIEALRAAQLELIERRETEHPIHWAPFILIGDWL